MEIVVMKLVRVLVALLLLIVRRDGSQVVGLETDHGHNEETALILLRSQAESIHKSDFPKDMVFRVSSSAYQYKGAAHEGGRGPFIWDTVAHIPGHTPDNSTGDLGVDQYHRYKEDVELMKDLQVDTYRVSFSWSRLFSVHNLGLKEIMALDWHRPAGKSIRDGTLRSLAKKGLDILDIAGVSIVGDYNHSSRHLIDGVIGNHVEEALGSAKYEEVCKQRTVLNNIHYCQSGLSFVEGFHDPHKIIPVPGSSDLGDAVARPAIINHDYLVLEVEYGYGGEKVFIRAEKTGHPPEKAGILITVDSKYEETESTVRLFTIRCFGRDIGRLPEILAILADHSPEYSMRDQNCWQYTRWTARRLMQQCQQQGQGELSDEELRLLQIEEDSIERRIASTHLKRIVKKGKQALKSLWKAWGSSGQGHVSMELGPVHEPNA